METIVFSYGGVVGGMRSINYSEGTLVVYKKFEAIKRRTGLNLTWFWEEIDHIGVWEWQSSYDCPGFLDGIQWELYLRRGDKQMESFGSNLFPPNVRFLARVKSPSFKRLCTAIDHLVGHPFIPY